MQYRPITGSYNVASLSAASAFRTSELKYELANRLWRVVFMKHEAPTFNRGFIFTSDV